MADQLLARLADGSRAGLHTIGGCLLARDSTGQRRWRAPKALQSLPAAQPRP